MSSQPPYGYPPQGGYPPQQGGYPPPPGGYGYSPQGPRKTKVMNLDSNVAGLLSYIPCCIGLIFSIIFVSTEPKDNRFVRFHAMQSLFLHGAGLAIGLVFFVISFMLTIMRLGVVSLLVSLISWIVGLGFLVLLVIVMVKAYQNEMWKIPVIGNLAEKNS
jgi:uncharacterized membrane protein